MLEEGWKPVKHQGEAQLTIESRKVAGSKIPMVQRQYTASATCMHCITAIYSASQPSQPYTLHHSHHSHILCITAIYSAPQPSQQYSLHRSNTHCGSVQVRAKTILSGVTLQDVARAMRPEARKEWEADAAYHVLPPYDQQSTTTQTMYEVPFTTRLSVNNFGPELGLNSVQFGA